MAKAVITEQAKYDLISDLCTEVYHMNGMKPMFIEGSTLRKEYYEQPNPYVNAPSCNVNLLELSRYAKKQNKKLMELTREEVNRFSI